MDDFRDYLRSRSVDGLRSLDAAHRADAYVVSFCVYDDDDDPRLPTLTVGTNTESQVKLATDPRSGFVKPNPWWTPTDEQEARWNFAFWLQNEVAVIGAQATDPAGAQLCREWLEGEGLWFDDFDYSEEAFARGDTITKAFVDLCVRTVQNLHSAGVIEEIFTRPIPVIIHELEYYEQIATQNREANGEDLAAGLIEWIAMM